MNILLVTLLFLLFGYIIWINHKLEKEKKRNRFTQAFIAGITRAISDYKSRTDIDKCDKDNYPQRSKNLPIPYENLLKCVGWEFDKDFWVEPYKKWLKYDRELFDDSKYRNDGFYFIYLDFFDDRLKLWFSNELISEKDKSYIRDDVEITENNVGELEGEIGMFKDLLNGELPIDSFTSDNFDEKMLQMFNHIKHEKLEELKKYILPKTTQ
jgi:hypothetical protein